MYLYKELTMETTEMLKLPITIKTPAKKVVPKSKKNKKSNEERADKFLKNFKAIQYTWECR